MKLFQGAQLCRFYKKLLISLVLPGCLSISTFGSDIVINEFIQHSFDYLLFDSLTTLLIYHRKEEIVIKFLSSIINVLKAFNCKGIFYVLNTDEHQLLIDEATMLMDKTVDIGY